MKACRVLVALLAWSSYASADPVSFEDAIHEAIKNNPQAAKAQEQINRAEGLMRQARASSLPTVNATGQYLRLDNDRSACLMPPCPPNMARVFVPADTVTANINITAPLINARGWVNWMHAGDQIDVAKATATDVARSVAITTARSYLTVIAARRVVDSQTRAQKTAQAHFDFAESRLNAGIGNKIDDVRANQQLQQTQVQLQNARISLLRAQEALGVLLGREGPVEVGAEPQLEVSSAMSSVESRTDVKAAQIRWHAAHAVRRDGWTDFLPTLTASFVPFFQEPASLTQPATGWQALFVLNVPLYDGGFRYGAQRERASLDEQARIDYDATVRQAKSELRTAIETVRYADDALVAARKNAELAEQALDLANTAYRAGATTNLEVIDAERVARDAQTQVAVAEDAARQARLDLLAASGRFP